MNDRHSHPRRPVLRLVPGRGVGDVDVLRFPVVLVGRAVLVGLDHQRWHPAEHEIDTGLVHRVDDLEADHMVCAGRSQFPHCPVPDRVEVAGAGLRQYLDRGQFPHGGLGQRLHPFGGNRCHPVGVQHQPVSAQVHRPFSRSLAERHQQSSPLHRHDDHADVGGAQALLPLEQFHILVQFV